MKKIGGLLCMAALMFAASPLAAEVNDSEGNISLRGALGGGKLFWGYVSHGNSSADLGTGPTGVLNLSAMYSYSFIGVEGNLLLGSISTLEWSDSDSFGISHDYKSEGSGYYTIFDIKIGARLFTNPGDMGYTFFYFGPRFWTTERTEDSLSVDGISTPLMKGTRKGNGNGWIVGYRDFSTIGPDNGFAIAIQTGFFFGKAPVEEFSQDGVEVTQPVDESFTIGGELAGGVALQELGFSIVGGFRGEIIASSFVDTAAPADEESVFGFGNIVFFVEAGLQF